MTSAATTDIQDALSPYYGALTQTAIDDITAALLPVIERAKAAELRRIASAPLRTPGLVYGADQDTKDGVARYLLNRAAELDGGCTR